MARIKKNVLTNRPKAQTTLGRINVTVDLPLPEGVTLEALAKDILETLGRRKVVTTITFR